MNRVKNRVRAAGLGTLAALAIAGCAEPKDRIEVTSGSQGRITVNYVPRDTPEASPTAVATPTQGASPEPVASSPPPTPVNSPTTGSTDTASKEQRIERLQEKVREMNAEIERLKTQPSQ